MNGLEPFTGRRLYESLATADIDDDRTWLELAVRANSEIPITRMTNGDNLLEGDIRNMLVTVDAVDWDGRIPIDVAI